MGFKRYFSVSQMRLPALSFASQMHTVSDEDKARGSQIQEVPKVPTAMMALPARRSSITDIIAILM